MRVYPAPSMVFVLRYFERVNPSTVDFCFDVSHQTIKETRQAIVKARTQSNFNE